MEPFYEQPYQQTYKPTSKFALVSMILGICSLVLLCTVFFPIILGGLGLIFAILSKRKDKKMETAAMTGVITSSIGLGLSLIFCIISVISAIHMLKPENRDMLNQMYEDTLGITYDEYIEGLYGEDILKQLDEFY